MTRLTKTLAAASVLLAAAAAQGALINRGGGMIYDDVQNITWLQDWNYAGTSGYSTGDPYPAGAMNGVEAAAWAASLEFGGYSDWRLPATLQPDPSCSDVRPPGYNSYTNATYQGFNCIGSEMGYMFYNYLGGRAGESVLNQSGDSDEELSNFGLFTNIKSFGYWGGTIHERGGGFTDHVWMFGTADGSQSPGGPLNGYTWAVAVRDGDVGAVPEPSSLAIALTALLSLAATQNRRLAARSTRRQAGLFSRPCPRNLQTPSVSAGRGLRRQI